MGWDWSDSDGQDLEPIYQFPAGVFFGRIISFQLHADMTKFGFYSC